VTYAPTFAQVHNVVQVGQQGHLLLEQQQGVNAYQEVIMITALARAVFLPPTFPLFPHLASPS